MKRVIFVAMMAAALAVAPKAEAAFILGGVSITGGYTPYAGPGYANPVGNVATANVLDFGSNGAPAGAYRNGSCSGDYLTILGPCDPITGTLGDIKDMDITGGVGAMVVPSFLASINGFAFNLATITLIDRGVSDQLTIKGTGTVAATGWDTTQGTWNFTANSGGGTFTWSASVTSVPEPGSMLLLGTGLLGLAAAARRRIRKA